MKRLVTVTMFGIFFSGCLPLGCTVQGYRKLSVEVFGQKFSVEDKVSDKQDAADNYTVSFDSEAWAWLYDWAKSDENGGEDESPDEVEDDGTTDTSTDADPD